MLPEKRSGVEGIKRDPVRPVMKCQESQSIETSCRSGLGGIYSFNRSSCDFLGIISSICGASRGYVSQTLVLMARWTEDLTLDFAPAEMLVSNVS